MDEKKDDEIPSAVSFFSKRAKLVAKVTPEELKAASELLNKIEQSRSQATSSKEKAVKKPRKSSRNKKGPSVELVEVKDDVIADIPEAKLSAAAKRRLKKIQAEKDWELQCMEAENEKVLSAIKSSFCSEVEEVPVDDFDKMNVLTISYLSEISRMSCHNKDKFSTIFTKVASLFNLKVSEFLLCFKDHIIKVEETPESLNITDSDILECIPYKSDGNCESEAQYDGNSIKIVFQASDSKEKNHIVVHKLEKMQDIMEKYSKLRGIPLNLLTFEFDGEEISGTETPEDLDMESGICIDVRVSTSVEKTKKKKKDGIVFTVDSDSHDSDVVYVED